MPVLRHRPTSRRPIWIIVLISLVCISLIGAYIYPPQHYPACYFFTSSVCTPFKDWFPAMATRPPTDDELASRVVIRDILSLPSVQSKNPKIAFMFLTPGSLPFERLWEKFFLWEGTTITSISSSCLEFYHKVELKSTCSNVVWGKISMVDAEKRLLANALQDTENQHFVLLSDSCVPLHNFDYVYNYLMATNISFIDCFQDPGPHGNGRYSEHMLPEVEERDFRKGAQWFSLKRQHALLILADSLYYTKFKLYCKPNMDGRNCYADEHYLPTLFQMVDPSGIANWSVTHVDWSEGKWHPKAYRARDVTYELLKNITSIDESYHVTSDEKVLLYHPNPSYPPSISLWPRRCKISTVRASIAARPVVGAPDDLVASILSKVKGTDGGVLLTKDGHKEVADVALQLEKYCVDEPVKCPLIFGEWDVVYCSRPTSPGGGYRSAFGRLVFKTNEMVQVMEAPDTVRNMVSFSAFGFLDGEVSLKGTLKALDDKWIQVIFEPPKLKIGSLGFQYGGKSELETFHVIKKSEDKLVTPFGIGDPRAKAAYLLSSVYAQKETCSEELLVEQLVHKGLHQVVIHEGESSKQKSVNPKLQLIWGSTMYHIDDLPFEAKNLPDVYTQFRKAVESKCSIRSCFKLPASLGPLPSSSLDEIGGQGTIPTLEQLGYNEKKAGQ
ncbi:putative glycosyltransferase BC10 [Cocos nucifera]|uniref:Putative glycosyltransferase BC10 n=1 Tax=Cocos nucifera TaxID=13894 RepID=A0A8K0IPT7_COCNU|nr:putative glycosyltransferase BC10 [Cocos nucifera]